MVGEFEDCGERERERDSGGCSDREDAWDPAAREGEGLEETLVESGYEETEIEYVCSCPRTRDPRRRRPILRILEFYTTRSSKEGAMKFVSRCGLGSP